MTRGKGEGDYDMISSKATNLEWKWILSTRPVSTTSSRNHLDRVPRGLHVLVDVPHATWLQLPRNDLHDPKYYRLQPIKKICANRRRNKPPHSHIVPNCVWRMLSRWHEWAMIKFHSINGRVNQCRNSPHRYIHIASPTQHHHGTNFWLKKSLFHGNGKLHDANREWYYRCQSEVERWQLVVNSNTKQ